ncbi:type II toxin-antitoxin system VapC family toxin [Aliarcobacter butzleri]|uniref:type II toxin-antitoxin system VapC family toxin n=1 Tax=Aliarcobacter butzleri TaxID=28197 RepID=UPI003AFB5149
MSNRYKDTNLSTISNKKIFFDTNILIFIFWSTTSEWEPKYSKVYSTIEKQNNEFFISLTVLSEFINRIMQFDYSYYLKDKNLKRSEFSFKEFRNTSIGQETLDDLYTFIKEELLIDFKIVDHHFTQEDIISICKLDTLDINDKIILKICKEHELILLTNDGDFKDSDIDIISCNSYLTNC